MATFYLESIKHPKLRFQIMDLNKQTMKAVLKGGTGVPFSQVISQDVLTKYGYKIVKVADHEAESV